MNIMKLKLTSILFLFCIMLSACGAVDTPLPPATTTPASFKFFQDGYYQVIVPGWEETAVLDADSIFTIQKDGQFITVNRYKNLPEIFAPQFKAHIEEEQNAYLVQEKDLDGRIFFEYTTRENNQTMRMQAVLEYCQGQTYALIAGGRDTVENADLFEQVLSSSSCDDPVQVPDLQTGKIGMQVNPAEDDFWNGYYPALRLAKANGVQVLHSYMFWGQVEYTPNSRSWDLNDALMGYRFNEGFEVSLVVNLIHTGVIGPIPEDLQNKRLYIYILEEVETDGGTKEHGPVKAVPRLIYGLKN